MYLEGKGNSPKYGPDFIFNMLYYVDNYAFYLNWTQIDTKLIKTIYLDHWAHIHQVEAAIVPKSYNNYQKLQQGQTHPDTQE